MDQGDRLELDMDRDSAGFVQRRGGRSEPELLARKPLWHLRNREAQGRAIYGVPPGRELAGQRPGERAGGEALVSQHDGPESTLPSAGRLVLKDLQDGKAQDVSGAYELIDLHWQIPGKEATLVTGFHLYQDRPYLVFVQQFPQGSAATRVATGRSPR